MYLGAAMRIHNFLPIFLECLERWKDLPSADEFARTYYAAISPLVGVVFDDFEKRIGGDLYAVLEGLNWSTYRDHAVRLSPAAEEARLRKHIASVERCLGVTLEGDAILFGAFTCMDGYARFDEGRHRVFLGVDESHGRGAYLDVLMAHELTHVARESRPEVWTGFGLDPKMTHDQFTESQPVVEHLMNEGFSCVVSELLVPGVDPWHYAYVEEDVLARVLEHGPAVDRAIQRELREEKGVYYRLYSPDSYLPRLPTFTHYVWAWQWVKALLAEFGGGDPRRLLARCSKDFVAHALDFRLTGLAR